MISFSFLFIAFLYLLILVSKYTLSSKYLSKKKVDNTLQYTTTIVQPILSGDPLLEDMLTSNIVENLNNNFYWLIDDKDKVAQDIVNKIKTNYPSVKITVFSFPPCPMKINPKVFKISQVISKINTESFIVLDDDTYLPNKTLNTLVEQLNSCELSTALPFYRHNNTFFSKLMTQFVNNNSTLTYIPPLFFSKPLSINGMCYALKTKTAIEFDSFNGIKGFLADDLSLAKLLSNSNKRLIQIVEPVFLQTFLNQGGVYSKLMHRWFLFAKLFLENHSFKNNFFMLISQGIHPFLLWSMFLLSIINQNMYEVFLLGSVLLLRAILLISINKKYTGLGNHNYLLSVISELLQPIHFIHSLVSRKIKWRTHYYHVIRNEEFYELKNEK